MALRVSGFPLVVLTAIGDMPLVAVPVIYPYVHFCAAVLTEKQILMKSMDWILYRYCPPGMIDKQR